MRQPKSMLLRFWGVRGSLPVPEPGTKGIGGNTACVEVSLPDGDVLLIDCGTGARAAGRSLQRRMSRKPGRIHIFFSHFHWDHIQGLPFFSPLYQKQSDIRFYSRVSIQRMSKILKTQMSSPYFPKKFTASPARLSFVQLSDQTITLGGARISSFRLHHPQGAWGYRIEYNDNSIVYACDHEHGSPSHDRSLRAAAQNATILIYDAQFTPAEYKLNRGWGHSNWLEGVRLAERAGVTKLVLFHHSPDRTDTAIKRLVAQAQRIFPSTIAAREGLTLRL